MRPGVRRGEAMLRLKTAAAAAWPGGCYNRPVRILLLVCLWIAALCALCLAADTPQLGAAQSPCTAAAERCCGAITQACVVLRYTPRCDYPAHKCVPTYYPCAAEICLPAACHKPMVTCYPEAPCACLPEVCHKPAVTAYPEDPCPVEPVLTGDRSLILGWCGCEEDS